MYSMCQVERVGWCCTVLYCHQDVVKGRYWVEYMIQLEREMSKSASGANCREISYEGKFGRKWGHLSVIRTVFNKYASEEWTKQCTHGNSTEHLNFLRNPQFNSPKCASNLERRELRMQFPAVPYIDRDRLDRVIGSYCVEGRLQRCVSV
jgi:hypothetical protein